MCESRGLLLKPLLLAPLAIAGAADTTPSSAVRARAAAPARPRPIYRAALLARARGPSVPRRGAVRADGGRLGGRSADQCLAHRGLCAWDCARRGRSGLRS